MKKWVLGLLTLLTLFAAGCSCTPEEQTYYTTRPKIDWAGDDEGLGERRVAGVVERRRANGEGRGRRRRGRRAGALAGFGVLGDGRRAAVSARSDEEGEGKDQRVVLRFHPLIAPVTVAIFPLVKKEGMPEKAAEIEAGLRSTFRTAGSTSVTPGRRTRAGGSMPAHS